MTYAQKEGVSIETNSHGEIANKNIKAAIITMMKYKKRNILVTNG